MKTVRLPLFEDGLELNSYLEIDVEHFLGAAGDATAHRYMRVVEGLTPEQEIEMLDRIIHDMPTVPHQTYYEGANDWIGEALSRMDKSNPWKEHNQRKLAEEAERSWDEKILENGRLTRIHLVPGDEGIGKIEVVGSASVESRIPDLWRPIPGWPGYEMNRERTIVDSETGTTVPLVEKGRQTKRNASVLLHHEEGGVSHMNVAWLFRQTFPEM